MKRLYLDCEFNGFGGELISIALVDKPKTDVGFYCGAILVEPPLDWVRKNVLPALDLSFMPYLPVHTNTLADYLVTFLRNYSADSGWVEVVADHPADFFHLARLLDVWSSQNDFASPPFQLRMSLVHSGELESAVPHNALEDALALARWGEKELGA